MKIQKVFLLFLTLTVISLTITVILPSKSFLNFYLINSTIILGGVTGILFIYTVFTLLLPGSGTMMSEEDKKDSMSDVAKEEMNRSKIDPDQLGKTSQNKRSLLSKIIPFGGKNRCSECGSELEYKEETESYYCPQCRTYK